MQRNRLAAAVALGALVWAGCSSSNSTQAPNDMDAMASDLDSSKRSTPPDASSTASAAPATTAAESAPPVAAAPVDPSLRTKRGFGLKEWDEEVAYFLVKADATKVAEALAKEVNGKVVKDALGKPVDDEKSQVVVFQFAGHPWSIFSCGGHMLETLPKSLSRDSDVFVVWNSDFNGWTVLDLYRGGQEVEALHWGYAEDKIGEDADASKWQTSAEIPRKYEGEDISELYVFRSKLRQITPADLKKGQAFVDAMLRSNDAYLPESDHMPRTDSEDSETVTSPLGPAAFSAVHMVEIAD